MEKETYGENDFLLSQSKSSSFSLNDEGRRGSTDSFSLNDFRKDDEEEIDLSSLPRFHPSRATFRLIMIIAICFLTFGSYYCYDIPGATTTSLESQYEISQAEYTLLYAIYSLPNTVLPFFGGSLIDGFLGLRNAGLVFCLLVLVGQIIWAAGSFLVPSISAYYIALLGRFVFGLGGESLSVAQSAYAAKWFTGKELALAFGIALSFSRIGSAVNFIISPIINAYTNITVLLWFGVLLCLVSMASAIVLAVMDKVGEKYETKKVTQDPIQWRDILNFPLSLWLVFLVCVTFYVSIFTFISISSAFFQYKWGYSELEGNLITSFPYFLSAFISPYSGFLVDKLGRPVIWFSSAALAVSISHILLMITPADTLGFVPAIIMIVMGVGYTYCAASLWPSVALLVAPNEIGTAYGMMTAIQNTGLTISPVIIGLLTNSKDHDPYYNIAELFFATSAFISFLLSCFLMYKDKKGSGVLLASPFDNPRAETVIVSEYEDND